MDKVFPNAAAALAGVVRDGQLMAVGGFGLCGIPEALIEALRDSRVKDLTVISNNAGVDGFGLGKLLETRQIRKMISSYVGENKEFERQYLSGRARARVHAARHAGREAACRRRGHPRLSITRTGVGTLVAEGKEHARVRRRDVYIMERAHPRPRSRSSRRRRPTSTGNLVYPSSTARNFNPNACAMAGKRHRSSRSRRLSKTGSIDPDAVHTARHLRASGSCSTSHAGKADREAHPARGRHGGSRARHGKAGEAAREAVEVIAKAAERTGV